MSIGASVIPAPLILGHSLQRLVRSSAGIESEKDVNGWFQTHLGVTYSAVWRKMNPTTGSWDERDLLKVAAGLGIELEGLILALSCGGNRLVDANIDVLGSKAFRKVVLGEPTTSLADHGLVAFESEGRWSVLNVIHAGNLGPQVFFTVKAVNLTPMAGQNYVVAHIDDDETTTEAAKELLAMENIDSTPYADDDAFLRACATKQFDALIVDWGLATTTAERLIREFREFKGCASKPIVLVTGQVRSDSDSVLDDLKRVSRDYGCTVLTKPVRWRLVAAELLQQIEVDKTRKAVG